MCDRNKRQKTKLVTEEVSSTLLQRYKPTAVLKLMQEVANYPTSKIDWNDIVSRTATGITSASEYQMLWRHIAYLNPLRYLEDGAQLMDDDSDLEMEMEVFPPTNNESSTEAAACVKVMTASGLLSESSQRNNSTVEAPLTINIPNGTLFTGPLESQQPSGSKRSKNITVPVSVQKQPLPTVVFSEGLHMEGSGSGNLPPRRKRKPWSQSEDKDLMEAVKKNGAGNWSNILKGDFPGDRTPSQLSQRWAIIKKRRGNSSVAQNQPGINQEAKRAANHALSLAIGNRPQSKNLTPVGISQGPSSSKSATAAEVPMVGSSSSKAQLQTVSVPTKTPALPKSLAFAKHTLPKSISSSNAVATASPVAVRDSVANQSATAPLLPGHHIKTAIHTSTAGNSVKPPVPSGSPAQIGARPNASALTFDGGAARYRTRPAVTAGTSSGVTTQIGARPAIPATPSAAIATQMGARPSIRAATSAGVATQMGARPSIPALTSAGVATQIGARPSIPALANQMGVRPSIPTALTSAGAATQMGARTSVAALTSAGAATQMGARTSVPAFTSSGAVTQMGARPSLPAHTSAGVTTQHGGCPTMPSGAATQSRPRPSVSSVTQMRACSTASVGAASQIRGHSTVSAEAATHTGVRSTVSVKATTQTGGRPMVSPVTSTGVATQIGPRPIVSALASAGVSTQNRARHIPAATSAAATTQIRVRPPTVPAVTSAALQPRSVVGSAAIQRSVPTASVPNTPFARTNVRTPSPAKELPSNRKVELTGEIKLSKSDNKLITEQGQTCFAGTVPNRKPQEKPAMKISMEGLDKHVSTNPMTDTVMSHQANVKGRQVDQATLSGDNRITTVVSSRVSQADQASSSVNNRSKTVVPSPVSQAVQASSSVNNRSKTVVPSPVSQADQASSNVNKSNTVVPSQVNGNKVQAVGGKNTDN